MKAGGGRNAVRTDRVSNSTITNNTVGLANRGFGGLLLSRGNNTLEGNGSATAGTIGTFTPQ